MSKRDLKNYLMELSKQQVAEQIMDLYLKFPEVKTYYDFVFHPNEEKLLREAKVKISNEYFPVKGKRPKMRRSTGQKIIKHFKSLGVDDFLTVDVMLYNIEIAQVYANEYRIKSETFYKSYYTSFSQSVSFIMEKGILTDFKLRLQQISATTTRQKWPNQFEFNTILERLDY